MMQNQSRQANTVYGNTTSTRANLYARLLPLLGILAQPYASASSDSFILTIIAEVVSQPCSLRPGDEIINISLGNITDEELLREGKTPVHPFQIHLDKCDSNVAKNVKVTFIGSQEKGDASLLALSERSEAKGIAIGITQGNYQLLPINVASSPISIKNGSMALDFGVYIKLLSAKLLKSGSFESSAFIRIDYS
ncbi:fimbrial protein [Aeromonas salmonicida]|uniref:fimbrial protein n=1 Tax=Aeromonas salmonicida TaxID=645 RepID=UPI0039A48299